MVVVAGTPSVTPDQMPNASSVRGPARPSTRSGGCVPWNQLTASAVVWSYTPVSGWVDMPRTPSANCRQITSLPVSPMVSSASARQPVTVGTAAVAGADAVSGPRHNNAPATVTARARPSFMSAQSLDDHGHALAAADAHRLQAEGLVGMLQAVDERRHDARAGHAERVAEGDARRR